MAEVRSRRSLTREQTARAARLRKRNAAFLANSPDAKGGPPFRDTSTIVYECSYCCMISTNKEEVRLHTTQNHQKVPKCQPTETKCPFCRHQARDNNSLKVHLGKCEMKMLQEMMVAKYVVSPNDPVKKITIQNNIYKVYKCKACEFEHVSKTAVRRHATIVHFLEVPVFSCIYCDTGIADRGVFDIHLRVSHRPKAIDFSFDCVALSLLNILLEHSVEGVIVGAKIFKQEELQKGVNFPILNIYERLQVMKKSAETPAMKGNKKENSTRSKAKSDTSTKSFSKSVKMLLETRSGKKRVENKPGSPDTSNSPQKNTEFSFKDISAILDIVLEDKQDSTKTKEKSSSKTADDVLEKDENHEDKSKSTGGKKRKYSEIVSKDDEKTDDTGKEDAIPKQQEEKTKSSKKGEDEEDSDEVELIEDSADLAQRYNLRQRKPGHSLTEKDDEDSSGENEESEENETPPKHPSPTKTTPGASGETVRTMVRTVQPIVIEPIEELADSPIKRPRIDSHVVKPVINLSPSKAGSNTAPNIITPVGAQILQPHSYMLINGQLVPVLSPVVGTNLQQPMVIPQLPHTLPMQIQQMRPTVLNAQSLPQGFNILGNTLPQNLVLNKQVGMAGNPGMNLMQPIQNPVQMLPNVIRLPQQNPTVLQAPNAMVTSQQQRPLVVQQGGQPAQFRLEKNSQGVISLQPIPGLSFQPPVSTVTQPTTVRPPTLTAISSTNALPANSPLNVGAIRSVLGTPSETDRTDDFPMEEVESDSDTEVGAITVPASSETNPELLLVTLFLCRKCRIMRTSKKSMVQHVVTTHSDSNLDETTRRKSVLLSKGSYYVVSQIQVMRAKNDWDIPLYRCRICHLFHVFPGPVENHVSTEHATLAGLTEPSRHSLRHPRDLVKIGYDVMSKSPTGNLRVLGNIMKEQPKWAQEFLSKGSTSAIKVYKRVSCRYLFQLAFSLQQNDEKQTKKVKNDTLKPQALASSSSGVNASGGKILGVAHIRPKGSQLQAPPVMRYTTDKLRNVPGGLKIMGHGCMKCDFRHKSYQAVKDHVQTVHHNNKKATFVCRYCTYTNALASNMKEHAKSYHQITTPAINYDFLKKLIGDCKSLVSTYYDSNPDMWKDLPSAQGSGNAEKGEEHVEPDSSCDVEKAQKRKTSSVSAPNILSCLQEEEEGVSESNLVAYSQKSGEKPGEDDMEDEEEAVNLEGSENTTGEAYACRLCAYSCDTLQRMKSHMMSTHIANNMYPFRCPTCGYVVPSTLRLAQHIQYKHQKSAKKNPPKLAREMQEDKKLWPRIVPDLKKYERFQQELDCLFRNCVEKE